VLGRSTLRAETIEPQADPRWQRFVESSPTAGVFHHVEWLRLLQAQYRYPLRALCVVTGNGEIRGGVPFAEIRSRLTGTRLVAVPFSDTCGPVLARPDDEVARRLLADEIRGEHTRTGTSIEIRAPFGDLGAGARYYRHELALGEGVEAGFSKDVKRCITRARDGGVEVVRRTDGVGLDAFYRLHLLTRRRQGVPTQPKSFIARFSDLFERDLGCVLLAQWQGEPIAAAVFLAFKGVLTYKYAASDRHHLGRRPNHAILAAAIGWGCDACFHTFDFGRTDFDNDGLRAFKRSWGAEEREFHYTRLPSMGSDGAGVPKVAKTLIAHTPPITGRLVGQALYRHFG